MTFTSIRQKSLSKVRGVPDYEAVKSNLYKAIRYSPTLTHKEEARAFLNQIKFRQLLQQADASSEKNSIEGLETALRLLAQAQRFGATDSDKELLGEKTAKINEAIEKLKQKINKMKTMPQQH